MTAGKLNPFSRPVVLHNMEEYTDQMSSENSKVLIMLGEGTGIKEDIPSLGWGVGREMRKWKLMFIEHLLHASTKPVTLHTLHT